MNQRKAKALRRASGFVVGDVREYDYIVRKRDKNGNPSSMQTICTGARVNYQNMKKVIK